MKMRGFSAALSSHSLFLNRISRTEVLDETTADAYARVVFGNVLAFDPSGAGEFSLLHVDGRVAVEFCGVARDERFRERPRLATEVLDVLDADARFFKDFALDSLFKRFADFYEPRNEVHARFVWIVQIAGHQKFIAIANCNDNDR